MCKYACSEEHPERSLGDAFYRSGPLAALCEFMNLRTASRECVKSCLRQIHGAVVVPSEVAIVLDDSNASQSAFGRVRHAAKGDAQGAD